MINDAVTATGANMGISRGKKLNERGNAPPNRVGEIAEDRRVR